MIEIYKITNTVNGKCYIGQTCRGAEVRFKQHLNSDSILGRAIKKYGSAVFTLEVLCSTCDKDEANRLEHENILKFKTVTPNGYNANEYGRVVGNVFPKSKVKKLHDKMFLNHKMCVQPFVKISSNEEILEKYINKLGNADFCRLFDIVCRIDKNGRIMYGKNPNQYCRILLDINKIVKIGGRRQLNRFLKTLVDLDLVRIAKGETKNKTMIEYVTVNPAVAVSGIFFDSVTALTWKDIILEYKLMSEEELECLQINKV